MPSPHTPDTSFDRYARMVRRTLGVPVALVSIVEQTRQVFPGAVGLPEPYQSQRETPLSHSFCQYVVADRAPMVIADARVDARLRDNLAIEELQVVAYAGWPITDHTGQIVGSLCAIDGLPRRWDDDDLELLEDLAAACSAELAQRELRRLAQHEIERVAHLGRRSRVLLALSERLSTTRTLAEVAVAVEQVGLEQLGCSHAGLWLRDDLGHTDHLDATSRAATLEFVPGPRSAWSQARRFSQFPADEHNPVGEVFLRQAPRFFPDRAAQDAVYATTPEGHRSTDTGVGRAMVPLGLAGQWFGTLVLVWPDERDFGPDERATIGAAATYTSGAVARAALMAERVQVSSTLQKAMLSDLPQPPGLQVAARYRPAGAREQVGGDWYDALVLPSGRTALVIGDVVGHDIAAAAVMGQLRNTLRAFAWALEESPAASVARLDQAMPALHMTTMASLVLATLEEPPEGPEGPDAWTLRWTNAGHPRPLLVDPEGRTRWLETPPEVMLGVETSLPRVDHEVLVAPGSLLLLFTDGLVERRGADLDDGLERLRGSLLSRRADLGADTSVAGLEGLLEALLDDLLEPTLDDDVAVLVVGVGRRSG